jgi:hypothetical protein
MTQKWNLQDIRPAQPREPRRPQPSAPLPRPHSQGDMRQNHAETEIAEPTFRQPHHDTREVIDEDSYNEDDGEGNVPVINGNKRSRGNLYLGIFLAVLIIAGGLGISALTGGAEITIYPKVRELNVNAEFTAYAEMKPGELSYEIMTLDASGERQVKASGQETVTKQATGEIEISKSTPGAERLIKNTRFASAEGLVFRIQESVVVPGAVKGADGNSVPGVIRAQVFADEPGEKYNIPVNTALTVPGFKEGGYTELYNAISAKNTAAFVDGFNGPRFIINDAELSTARQSLQLELRNALLAKIKAESPADFTSFVDSIAITYNPLPPTQYGDDLVTIKEQAVLQIPLFKKEDFAKFIAKETIVGYENEPVRIDNLENLTFAYVSATTSQSNIANEPSLTFKIAGVPKIVWTVDGEKMKTELLGKEKTAFTVVLGNYTGIERGEVEVRPFWKRSFPTTLKDIRIKEDLSTTQQ